jgi:hypothetical protein
VKVVSNKGAPGPDGRTVGELREQWPGRSPVRGLPLRCLTGRIDPARSAGRTSPRRAAACGLGIPNVTDNAIRSELQQIATVAPGDVYIVAIYMWTRPSSDPRWCTLELLWSTEQRFAKRARRASGDELDGARWSTMYMERRGHDIWNFNIDPAGYAAFEHWARQEDLWPPDPDRHGCPRLAFALPRMEPPRQSP